MVIMHAVSCTLQPLLPVSKHLTNQQNMIPVTTNIKNLLRYDNF